MPLFAITDRSLLPRFTRDWRWACVAPATGSEESIIRLTHIVTWTPERGFAFGTPEE